MSLLKTNPVEAGSYTGAIISVVSSLTLTDIGIIIGIITALLTYAMNAFYAARKDKREQREHEARMKALEGATQ
ncbi:holin family protein (superfamily II) [Paucimonas lemoignei]|uniref:Holin family protein (Superfamily II) n=2 Tax=Paucimonas lemoignei TaxID=29443 RepID=A0A4V2UIE5_PAULE|nr:holin family protein (superfamily II) [Paucimonas lemoignei]